MNFMVLGNYCDSYMADCHLHVLCGEYRKHQDFVSCNNLSDNVQIIICCIDKLTTDCRVPAYCTMCWQMYCMFGSLLMMVWQLQTLSATVSTAWAHNLLHFSHTVLVLWCCRLLIAWDIFQQFTTILEPVMPFKYLAPRHHLFATHYLKYI